MKRKILKAILIILILVIVAFTVDTIRKLNVLNNVLSAQTMLRESTNYYIKRECADDNLSTIEAYYKDGNYKLILTYEEPAQQAIFYVINNEKIMTLDYDGTDSESANTYTVIEEGAPSVDFLLSQSFYEEETGFWDRLRVVLSTSVVTEEYNGKDVYKITYKYKSVIKTEEEIVTDEETIEWVDKDTYIKQKEENTNGSTYTYDIELDTVTDEDIVIPDLSEYTLLDSNDNSTTSTTETTEATEVTEAE